MAPKSILFPLRSNAKSLVTGAALNTVRSRLKLASLLYDTVLVEGGVLEVKAGPDASSTFWRPVDPGGETRWQTPFERGRAASRSFHIAIGAEETPGVPAPQLRSVVQSATTIAWSATMEPFRREVPTGGDWLEWIVTDDPYREAKSLQRDWVRRDMRNGVLEKSIPERFVRSRVVEDANRDMVIAATHGVVISQDALHASVLADRFARDSDGWQSIGFALPIIVPRVAGIPWESITDIRGDKSLQRLRNELREIEQQAMEEATSGGDIEAAVRHVYERRVRRLAGQTSGLTGTLQGAAVGFAVSMAAGTITMGITGPLGVAASAGLGGAAGGVVDLRAMVRDKRSKQWIGALNRLSDV